MDGILYFRAIVTSIVKKYESFFIFTAKFLLGLFVFSAINKLGFLRDEFLFLIMPPVGLLLLLMLAFLFAILPLTASYGLMAVYIGLHLSSNTEMAVIVLLSLLCLIFFYIRLAPKESIFVILTVIGFHFKLPYLAPMFAGLYFGLTAAIPVIAGVFIWYFIPEIMNLMTSSASAGLNVMEMTETIPGIYESVLAALTGSYEWVFVAFALTMIVVAVYAFSRLSINYSAEIAVLMGALINIISHIAAAAFIKVNAGVFGVMLSSVICAVIVCAARFFDIALDYNRVERVQFSDEDNYYYVKVVPKLLTTMTTDKKAAVAATAERRLAKRKQSEADSSEDLFKTSRYPGLPGSGESDIAKERPVREKATATRPRPERKGDAPRSDRTDMYDEILRTDRTARSSTTTRADRMDIYGRPIKTGDSKPAPEPARPPKKSLSDTAKVKTIPKRGSSERL